MNRFGDASGTVQPHNPDTFGVQPASPPDNQYQVPDSFNVGDWTIGPDISGHGQHLPESHAPNIVQPGVPSSARDSPHSAFNIEADLPAPSDNAVLDHGASDLDYHASPYQQPVTTSSTMVPQMQVPRPAPWSPSDGFVPRELQSLPSHPTPTPAIRGTWYATGPSQGPLVIPGVGYFVPDPVQGVANPPPTQDLQQQGWDALARYSEHYTPAPPQLLQREYHPNQDNIATYQDRASPQALQQGSPRIPLNAGMSMQSEQMHPALSATPYGAPGPYDGLYHPVQRPSLAPGGLQQLDQPVPGPSSMPAASVAGSDVESTEKKKQASRKRGATNVDGPAESKTRKPRKPAAGRKSKGTEERANSTDFILSEWMEKYAPQPGPATE